MEKKQKLYNPAADVLRVTAILAVVFIHTTTRILEASFFDLQKVPWTLFINQVSRFAVPLFFLVSGFVLELNYPFHKNYFSYLKKRVNRLFLPYVFWSAVYYFFVYTKHNRGFVAALFEGGSSYQLYFIPTLLIFYLLFPFVHKLYNYFINKYALLLLAILQFILLYQDYYRRPFPYFYPLTIAILNFYPFILGIFIEHHQEQLLKFIGKLKLILVLLTLGLAFYIFFEGKSLYLKTHNYLYFYSQWRPSILAYTFLLGGLLYYFFSKKTFSAVKSFSRVSFFVFFIHVIVLEFVWQKIGINVFQPTHSASKELIVYNLLFFLAVSFVSFFSAYLVHKIPLLPKLTG